MSDLNDMIEAQRRLQISSYGSDPGNLTGPDRVEFIRWNVLALEDELHEALAETGWKPWAKSTHVHEDAFKGELIDAFHFFMNLCIVADMDAFELYSRYMAKRQINAKRQEDGYDGVANKCPICKRALDDAAVLCSDKVCMG